MRDRAGRGHCFHMGAGAVVLAGLWAAAAWADEAPRTVYWIETLAGGQHAGDGGPAVAAQLSVVQGIAADRFGNLYLSDTDNHRVRKVSASGVITTVAGTGSAGAAGDGGPAGKAQLNLPYGLALDSAGNLFIADLGNQRVRQVGSDGIIRTVAGTGEKGWSGDGGAATSARLMSPRNLAVNAAGTLYVSEFEGHRVRVVWPGGVITTLAGNGLAGFRGDGGPAVRAQLNYPAGLAFDESGALLVADSGNRRIRKVAADGTITTVLGGTTDTMLFQPTGLAADPYGNIYVTEQTPTLRRFTPAGGQTAAAAVIAGNAQGGFGGDGGRAATALLTAPKDVALDPAGSIWIADGRRVRRVDRAGTITTIAGDAYQSALGDGGAASLAHLYQPASLAMDRGGSLYIADAGTHRIRKLTPDGVIWTLAGGSIAGASPDGTAAWLARFDHPMGVAALGDGSVVVADTYNHRVRQISPAGWLFTRAGSGVAGIGAEDAPVLAAPLRGPQSVAVGASGALYIADTGNHRVVAVTAGGQLRTVAGNGSPGYAGDGGVGTGAQLNSPAGLALDAAGVLYIADEGNHRIRTLDRNGIINTAAGSAGPGFSGDGGPATSAKLSRPRGVAVDGDGCLYIADTGNHRVRKVSAQGVIETIAGSEAAGFAGDGGPAGQARLDSPAAVLLDGSGKVYVSDTGNHRIRRLSPVSVPAPVELPREAVVLNAASRASGAVAPGELLAIVASEIGPEPQVLFDGEGALLLASEGELLCRAPDSLAGRSSTTVEIRYGGAPWLQVQLAVAAAAPGLYASILNQDGSVNGEKAPAARGSLLVLFATGEGAHDAPRTAGPSGYPPVTRPVLPVALTIAGVPAEMLWAGAVSGSPGLLQINARVPSGYVPSGQVPAVLTVGEFSAPAATLVLR